MKKIIPHEYEMTLADFRKGKTLQEVADLLNTSTNESIRQMLLFERQIYVKQIKGKWHYCELTPWKRGRRGMPPAKRKPVPRVKVDGRRKRKSAA